MKITSLIDLSDFLKNVPEEDKDSAKEAAAETLIEAILGDMNEGRSSVSGQKWEKLSKKYATDEKGGDRLSDLQLTGSYQSDLTYRIVGNKIEFGWWGGVNAKKADNHNNFGRFGSPTLPLRQSLPFEGEDIRPGIYKRIKEVVKEFYNTGSKNIDSEQ